MTAAGPPPPLNYFAAAGFLIGVAIGLVIAVVLLPLVLAVRAAVRAVRRIRALRALRERAAWRAVTRDEELRCQLTRAWLEERAEQVRRLIREHLGEDGDHP